MPAPISNTHPARAADRAHNAPPTADSTKKAATTFTREAGRSTAEQIATFGKKEFPVAPPMMGERTLSDMQLKNMGSEILQLYQQKVLGDNGRRVDFKVGGAGYSVRGADIGAVIIHSKQGLIQLDPEGMPMRNRIVPIESWEHLELGMTRVLNHLRNNDRPSRTPAAVKV